MLKALYITCPPTGINGALAAVLADLTVRVRPELLAWTEDPSLCTDTGYYWIHNDDILAALTAKLGISEALRSAPHLPIGRATRIPRDCCCQAVQTETALP